MKLLTVDTEEKRYNDCYLKVKNVGHEDSLLVELYSKSEGFIALLSNPGIRTTAQDEGLLCTTNYPWAMKFLTENNFAETLAFAETLFERRYLHVKYNREKMKEYEEKEE